ncbi:MAG: hypothetical protein AABY09_04055 [Nanoarchaeota archaeon]
MKKPYIRKYTQITDFTVWIVDGNYIRRHIDKQFTNFGQYHRFNYIPDHEFWIDREYSGDESLFFISHMLVEHRLMAQGKSFDEAFEKADLVERSERKKSRLFRSVSKIKKISVLINKIHKRLIKKYSQGKLKVWMVDGELVRDLFYIDFTEGGHDKVYKFIPENEVWIDDDLSPSERKYVLLHELYERNLMCIGWPYYVDVKESLDTRGNLLKTAHGAASALEYHFRHNPKDIEKRLLEEVKKSNNFYLHFKPENKD